MIIFDQIDFYDYLSIFEKYISCPSCNSKQAKKHTKRAGLKTFKCKKCGRNYSILSETFLSRTNYSWDMWVNMMYCTLENKSVYEIEQLFKEKYDLKTLNIKTIWAWRIKLLTEIAKLKKPKLKSVVQLDYIDIKKSFKGQKSQTKQSSQENDHIQIALAVDDRDYAVSKTCDDNQEYSKLNPYLQKSFSDVLIICTSVPIINSKYLEDNNIINYVKPRNYAEIILGNSYVYGMNPNPIDNEKRILQNKRISKLLYNQKLLDHIHGYHLDYEDFVDFKNQYKLGLFRVNSLKNQLLNCENINKSMMSASSKYLDLYIELEIFKHNFRTKYKNYPNSLEIAEALLYHIIFSQNKIPTKLLNFQ